MTLNGALEIWFGFLRGIGSAIGIMIVMAIGGLVLYLFLRVVLRQLRASDYGLFMYVPLAITGWFALTFALSYLSASAGAELDAENAHFLMFAISVFYALGAVGVGAYVEGDLEVGS